MTSAVPGDFDGDGGMDILVTTKYSDGTQDARLVRLMNSSAAYYT